MNPLQTLLLVLNVETIGSVDNVDSVDNIIQRFTCQNILYDGVFH